jgi:hypothetical protein
MAVLKGNFDVGPETYGWPGHTQHRFSRRDQHILIWACEGQADWWLTANEEESLKRVGPTLGAASLYYWTTVEPGTTGLTVFVI